MGDAIGDWEDVLSDDELDFYDIHSGNRKDRDEFETTCRWCQQRILMKHTGVRWRPYNIDNEPGYRVHHCQRTATLDDFEDVSQ